MPEPEPVETLASAAERPATIAGSIRKLRTSFVNIVSLRATGVSAFAR
jgi:hypothetical protein